MAEQRDARGPGPEKREVPGPGPENAERLQQRAYESEFAKLPEEEVEAIPAPGAGPAGNVGGGGRNLPLIVIAVGLLVVFTAFGFDSAWPLGIGLLLMVVGAVWAGAVNRGVGSGSGPTTIER